MTLGAQPYISQSELSFTVTLCPEGCNKKKLGFEIRPEKSVRRLCEFIESIIPLAASGLICLFQIPLIEETPNCTTALLRIGDHCVACSDGRSVRPENYARYGKSGLPNRKVREPSSGLGNEVPKQSSLRHLRSQK